MSDEFVKFLKEKKGAVLSLCNITVNELGQLVEQFIHEQNRGIALQIPVNIKWKTTRENLPPADKSIEWSHSSKRLMIYTAEGLMLFGRYYFEEKAYRVEGTGVTVSNVTHFVVAEKPLELRRGPDDDN